MLCYGETVMSFPHLLLDIGYVLQSMIKDLKVYILS